MLFFKKYDLVGGKDRVKTQRISLDLSCRLTQRRCLAKIIDFFSILYKLSTFLVFIIKCIYY